MKNSARIKVAVAQIAPIHLDIKANVEKHLAMIDQARKEDVDLLVFPELSLTGYSVGPNAVDASIGAGDPTLKKISKAAGNMTVVVGFIEAGYAAQIYNSAVVLRGGTDIFVHRKLNLATYGNLEEGKHFASGRYVESFPLTSPFVGSILICGDMWNPALVHLATLHGMTLLIVPTNSAYEGVGSDFSNPSGWQLSVRFYSMIYGLPIVMANRVGQEGALDFWGGSMITNPVGDDIVTAGNMEEGLISATLNYQDVRRARFRLPTVRDSNFALIRRELDRLDTQVGVPIGIRDT